MKGQAFLLVLFFIAADSISQVSKNNKAYTNVYHNLNNVTLKNYDGTSSTIYLNGNTATLFNSGGTHSTLNFFSNPSILTSTDGTTATVYHSRSSSTVVNSDGTQFIVQHKRSSSTCSSQDGIHSITHFFGIKKERLHADKIDVLVHNNWITQKKAEEVLLEASSKKQ